MSEFIDIKDTDDTGIYPEVNGNQLTLANYYPSQQPPLPSLSEPAIRPQQMALQMKSDLVDDQRFLSQSLRLKKLKQKKPIMGAKTRPAFVMKLWTMVNDPANENYIKWLPDGESFIVTDREAFMKSVLPKFFKHNNFASFVRQLNMYGWHKVQDVTHESIHSSGAQNPQESGQFKNPNFIRDREDLLDNIVRNKSSKDEEDMDFSLVFTELEQIKMNQMAIVEDLRRVRGDNQLLWEETLHARERHDKQTQTLDKIMRFLHQVYGNSNRIEGANNFSFGDLVQLTQPFPQSSNDQQSQTQQQPSSQDFQFSSQNTKDQRPRLMIENSSQRRIPSVPPIQELDSISNDSKNSPRFRNLNIQSVADEDISAIAPSPRMLFPELALPETDTSPVLNRIDDTITKQGESIKNLNDWIEKHAMNYSKGIDLDEFTPSEDSISLNNIEDTANNTNGNFDMEEFLLPTPQDYTNEANENNKKKRIHDTDHIGKIDEIVDDDEPEVKKTKLK